MNCASFYDIYLASRISRAFSFPSRILSSTASSIFLHVFLKKFQFLFPISSQMFRIYVRGRFFFSEHKIPFLVSVTDCKGKQVFTEIVNRSTHIIEGPSPLAKANYGKSTKCLGLEARKGKLCTTILTLTLPQYHPMLNQPFSTT